MLNNNNNRNQKNLNLTVRMKIAHLHPDIDNIELTCLVISKTDKRVVTSPKNPLKPLNVLGMVIRDSEMDFIHLSCWGSKEYIDNIANTIDIQSIIKIKNPLLKIKTENPNDEIYRPWTSSPFSLSLSEVTTNGNQLGTIELIDESLRPDLTCLKSLPIRDHNDFYYIEDIILDEKNKINQDANLLFCIRHIEPIAEVKRKNGTMGVKLELVIFDKTKDLFKLILWDKELIKFASTWIPKQTVVFGVDLKLEFNDYTKSLQASSSKKTIFIVNPDTHEGYSLYNYAKKVNFPDLISTLDQIKENAIKMTIEGLKKNLSQAILNEYVLLNAVITGFDIDLDNSRLFTFKCKRCELAINLKSKKCPNQNCKNQDLGYKKIVDKTFSLSDHTSTLSGVKLNPKLFETMIGMTIENFIELDDEAKTKLKWNFLFERKVLLVKVTCQSSESDQEAFLKYYFRLIEIEDLNEQNSNFSQN
ncbi:unnamed protein product [Brachionus calyciflorus]|uniref:MEIOB-like N-terminal domain-containing protein n=1 Tax=Brachionus calyciflorus TaxID=104777 RepID=A0A813V590_9BILA|nr:unnamed protein product [Brachionus calyciflorus]